MAMKLYNYFRSGASFRVRIALNLKGLAYEYIPVHIARGEHKKEAYAAMSADIASRRFDWKAIQARLCSSLRITSRK